MAAFLWREARIRWTNSAFVPDWAILSCVRRIFKKKDDNSLIMQGIIIMAIITTFLAVAIIGTILFIKSPSMMRHKLFFLVLLNIPIFFFAYYGLRLPLDALMNVLFSNNEMLYNFVKNFYAPLTEESAKLFIFIPVYYYKQLDKDNVHFYAFSTGLGFGIGEIWFLAVLLAQNPEISALPWYYFGGFLTERLCVCVLHGAHMFVTLYYLFKKNSSIGILFAMGLHFLTNFPIYLGYVLELQNNIIWGLLILFWVILMVIVMFIITSKLLYGKVRVGYMLMGQAKCPECSNTYDRPLFGIVLVKTRIERCPHCKHFHRVGKSISKEDELDMWEY